MRTAALGGWSLAVGVTLVVFGGCTSLLGDFKSSSNATDGSVRPDHVEAAATDDGMKQDSTADVLEDAADSASPEDVVSDVSCADASSVQNCGRCGHDCTNLPHVSGTVACTTAGACIFDSTACAPGYADCDGNADTGCETDLSQPAHCGTCSTKCGGATPACVPGATGSSFSCASGCPSTAPTLCSGSCSNTASDAKNCSMCGNACPPPANGQPACSGGTCGFTCNAGYHACGSGCAANTSPATCGSSCNPCPVPANATATCDTSGACGFTCNAGYHDCSGACVSNTSPATCGASCNACAVPLNATATCDGTNCGHTCNAGYHDCSGACDSDTSVNSCGTLCTPCTAPANAVATCTSAGCGFTCSNGLSPCGAACVNLTSDSSNCGVCGKACTSGIACTNKECMVRDGYTSVFANMTSCAPNYMFGILITVPNPITVTALGSIGKAATGAFVMGLYTDVGNAPSQLLGETSAANLVAGNLELPLLNPVSIAAGSYWVVTSTSGSGTWAWGTQSGGSYWFLMHTYTGAMPQPAPAGAISTLLEIFNYYIVGYE
jgi:hypothetical protein